MFSKLIDIFLKPKKHQFKTHCNSADGAQRQNDADFKPILLVHGGAGRIRDEEIHQRRCGIKLAARIGYETLQKTGKVMDAVQEAVSYLEFDPSFNAGYGSTLTSDGRVEMDASIMNGADLNAGCVSLARDIYHPVVLARRIMETTPHRYMAGDGAMHIARVEGFEILPPGALVTPHASAALERYKQKMKNTSKTANIEDLMQQKLYGSPGTVGAVAIDEYGNVAAATSTGGILGKLPGRIGDSSVLGAGNYADNAAGAVSVTGHGETIMRYNVASRILALIEHKNMTAQMACELVLNAMKERFNQTAGIIAIDRCGNHGIYFTTKRMSWAYQSGNKLHYGIDQGEEDMEIVMEGL